MNALQQLLAGYFHQDWDLDGGTSSDTVAAFLNEPTDVTTACAEQIDRLLAEDIPEGELQERLEIWGNQYRAGDTDEDYRGWLIDVRDQIRRSLA
jgi:hypothetical protein